MHTVQPSPLIGQTTNFLWKIIWWNIQHKALCSLDVHYKLQFYWGVPVGWLWHVRLHALCFVWRRKLPQVRRLVDMGHKLMNQNFDKNLKKPYNASAYFPQAFKEKQNKPQTQHKPDLLCYFSCFYKEEEINQDLSKARMKARGHTLM